VGDATVFVKNRAPWISLLRRSLEIQSPPVSTRSRSPVSASISRKIS
jgi:hypothetical protein